LARRTLTDLALGHRRVVLALTAVLLVLAGLGAARLRFDLSSRSFYGGDPVEAAALERLTAAFGPDDARLFVVVQANDDTGVVTPSRLRVLAELAEALAADPDVISASGLAELAPLDGGGRLVDRVTSDATAAAARTLLMASEAVPLLLSADGKTTVVAIELRQTSDDAAWVTPVVRRLTGLVATHAQRDPQLELQLAGVPALRAGFQSLSVSDQLLLQPLMWTTMAVVLLFAFRRRDGVLIPLVAAVVPTALLFGLMGWVGEPVGLLSQASFTLLPVIAMTDAVHWLTRVHELRRGDPTTEPIAAVEAAGRTVGLACKWTAVTTAAGFASMLVASMPALRSFGGWAAVGIGFVWLTVVTLVPTLISYVQTPPRPARPLGAAVLGRLATRRAGTVLLVASVVLAAAVAVGVQTKVDNRLSELLDAAHPVRIAGERVDAKLGGTLTVEILLEGAPDTFDDPEALRAIAELSKRLGTDPSVRAVLDPSSLPGDPTVVNASRSIARVRVFVPDAGGQAFAALVERVEANLPTIPNATATVTGTTRLAYAGVNRITTDLRRGLLGLVLVVTVVLAVRLRSARLALLALPVNIAPLVVGAALVGGWGRTLDPLAMIVFAVGLGLAVDDTIHLLFRAREHGGDRCEAIASAVATSGRAAVITSAVLALGLLVNLASSFPSLRMLGVLGAAIVVTALFADLLLLPAVVAVFGPPESVPNGPGPSEP